MKTFKRQRKSKRKKIIDRDSIAYQAYQFLKENPDGSISLERIPAYRPYPLKVLVSPFVPSGKLMMVNDTDLGALIIDEALEYL